MPHGWRRNEAVATARCPTGEHSRLWHAQDSLVPYDVCFRNDLCIEVYR
jgi:hypothetical protein